MKREEIKSKAREKDYKRRKVLVFEMLKNMNHFFPDLFIKLNEIEDFRQRSQYGISELIFAAISISLFKAGSRNSFNNMVSENLFSRNYMEAFGLSLPHLDSVDLILREIPNEALEKLKLHLVKGLILKKVFYKYRIFGHHFNISVDGTGVMNISNKNIDHYDNALFKKYNKGKIDEYKRYFINVLEAKLVCSNGFSISLCTEWIENTGSCRDTQPQPHVKIKTKSAPEEDSGKEYDKQDCELKAFFRLAKKLKSSFPRLPICIVADGLYPNQSVINICNNNNWEWIFTLKQGNLPLLWDQINLNILNNRVKILQDVTLIPCSNSNQERKTITKTFSWINDLEYKGIPCHWISMTEVSDGEIIHEFVYLTSFSASPKKVKEITQNGRLRFKIENEGFNSQKNLGYSMQHKFSETSQLATKNYYSCIQIGHMINQLFELSLTVKNETSGRYTIAALWRFIVGFFTFDSLNRDFIFTEHILNLRRPHIKFE